MCNCLYMYSVDLFFNLESHSNVGQTVGRPGQKIDADTYLASTFFQLWHLWFVTGPCRLEVCTAHGSDSLGVLEEKESQHAMEILHHRMAEV